jgi:hypothetical protein
MENRKPESFKQLEISAEKLPGSMARNESRTNYAAQRAELLLGCYRTGDANDPKTYVAAVTAVLAHFPEEVITAVTHPVTGLPKKVSWLPTIKEVNDACNEAVEPIRQHEARLKRIKEQMEARAREDAGMKPTMAQLKERFGENWGLPVPGNIKTPDEKAEENAMALERERGRVRAEYEQLGLAAPSKWALSPTALREMAERDEIKNRG